MKKYGQEELEKIRGKHRKDISREGRLQERYNNAHFRSNKDYYHFGASLKDVGKKSFMFSKIEDPDIVASIAEKYQKEWDAGYVEV